MVADANSTPEPRPRSLLRGNPPIYLPNGWEPIDAVLAWIAFGTALRRWEWDEYLFEGAGDLMTRAEVLRSLDQLAAEPGSLDGFLSGAPEAGVTLNDLPPSLSDGVADLASILKLRHARRTQQRLGDQLPNTERINRRAAKVRRWLLARRFHADPRWDGYGRDADMEALARAELTLLRKSAAGIVPLYGWPGGPGPEAFRRKNAADSTPLFGWPGSPGAPAITAPRLCIPRDLCAAPVAFDRDGTLLPCLQSDPRQSASPLFTDILAHADDLLAAFPSAFPAESQIIVPAPSRGRGGVRVSRQVAAANLALGAKLAAEGLPSPGDGKQAELEKWFVATVEAAEGRISQPRARVHVTRAIAAHRQALGMDR